MTELFLMILKQAVNASWIILAVFLARALTRRSAKWTRNLLWALVAVRLIVPFALESPISLVPTWQQETPQTVDAAPGTQDQPISAAVTVQVPDRVTVQQDAQPSGTQQSAAPVQQDAPAPSAQTVAEPVAQDVQRNALSALDIAGAVWMLGVVLMLLYNIVCHLRLRWRVRDAMLSSDGVWETEWLGAPMVIGYLRPRVYLPRSIDSVIREHIIAHERAHIRRGDHLTKMFAYLLLAVFWFHPLVWVAYYLFCRDVELACDERVIRGLDDEGVRAYARALLSYGSADRTTTATAQPAFAQMSVKTRLKNIVNYKKPTVWVIALTMVVCIATAACFLTVPKQVNASEIELLPESKTISIVPRTTPLEGESVEYEQNSYGEVYFNYSVYTDRVSVPIMNAPEDDQITVKLACVRSAEEYNSVISDNITENSLKDERQYLEKRYDEEFFQNNSLIFVFFGGGPDCIVYKDGEKITVKGNIIKNGNELCICSYSSISLHREMKRLAEIRNDRTKLQPAVVWYDWFYLIEVKDDLSDIDTISYYIEAID